MWYTIFRKIVTSNAIHFVYDCTIAQIYHLLDKIKNAIYDLDSALQIVRTNNSSSSVLHFLPEVYDEAGSAEQIVQGCTFDVMK